jgi:hypothetical protein
MYNLVYKIYECYKTQNNLPLKKNTKNTQNTQNTKNTKNTQNTQNTQNIKNTQNEINSINIKNVLNHDNHDNHKITKYATESLKKSIKKIEDECREPDYKSKILTANAFNDDYDSNRKKIFKIIAGTTTISFSLYLVYSFMKRYRT